MRHLHEGREARLEGGQIFGGLLNWKNHSSFVFLMPDPDSFQNFFEILSHTDGSLPETFENAEGCVLKCSDLDAFRNLPELADWYAGRRGFWRSKTVKNIEGCESFWNRLIQEK